MYFVHKAVGLICKNTDYLMELTMYIWYSYMEDSWTMYLGLFVGIGMNSQLDRWDFLVILSAVRLAEQVIVRN